MQGVPVIRCAAPNCSDRFCYECEKRWCSFRTRDQLPLCLSCTTSQKEANQAAALALGVTPLDATVKAKFSIPEKNKTTLPSLPQNMRVRNKSEIDNSATADNDGLSFGKLVLMSVVCVFSSLIIGGTWFVLF